ncbi:MAG TPA: ABC-F family ATP-binding cassette domain-containing protein [Anaerolineales bacterium]|nr:ABC-F family ATP-binding cassette domain-containing protein [Anaerolineales bacterium]
MLQISKLSKSFGAETVLREISFVVNRGDRIALIGPNGSGKSTLLKIITGELKPDDGVVAVASEAAVGYLPQGQPIDDDRTVREIILGGVPGWSDARREMERLSERLGGEDADIDSLLFKYGYAQRSFEQLGGYPREHEAERIAVGLGLPAATLDRPASTLSGGQRARAGLARLLITGPDLMLLDEPTNHLDITALEWLESTLAEFPGGILLVSHDRVFLDRIANKVIALDPETGTAREYTGNYSEFAAVLAREIEKTRQAWHDQQAEIRRMEADIHQTRMHAKSVELTTTSGQPTVRRYAKKVARKALSREKKLERYLDSDERVEKPEAGWRMKLAFDRSMRSGQQVLTIDSLSFAYPGAAPVLHKLDLELSYGDRTALVGDNGSGKSTLLKLIAGDLAPAAGRVALGSAVRIGYMPQEQEALSPERSALEVVQSARPMSETDARNFLHYFLFEGDAALLPAGRLSYGERARLLLAKLVVEGANFLVLDEPVNHLDIPSRERFEAALDAFPGTVLAAVHDRAFIRNFGRRVIRMEDGKLL